LEAGANKDAQDRVRFMRKYVMCFVHSFNFAPFILCLLFLPRFLVFWIFQLCIFVWARLDESMQVIVWDLNFQRRIISYVNNYNDNFCSHTQKGSTALDYAHKRGYQQCVDLLTAE
jgi:hypothetical protein